MKSNKNALIQIQSQDFEVVHFGYFLSVRNSDMVIFMVVSNQNRPCRNSETDHVAIPKHYYSLKKCFCKVAFSMILNGTFRSFSVYM